MAAPSIVLPDGRVVVIGGIGEDGLSSATTEIYDVEADTWEQRAPMHTGREWHTATLLPDGRVLVVGSVTYECWEEAYMPAWRRGCTTDCASGYLGSPSAQCYHRSDPPAEIYDVESDEWTVIEDEVASGISLGHTATLLLDGRVLLAGGEATLANALYDPETGEFEEVSRGLKVNYTTARRLPTGDVLIVGGSFNHDVAEVFRVDGEYFDGVPRLPGPWPGPSPLVLDDGSVLIVGSCDSTLHCSDDPHRAVLYFVDASPDEIPRLPLE
jgi:hypothetical protein